MWATELDPHYAKSTHAYSHLLLYTIYLLQAFPLVCKNVSTFLLFSCMSATIKLNSEFSFSQRQVILCLTTSIQNVPQTNVLANSHLHDPQVTYIWRHYINVFPKFALLLYQAWPPPSLMRKKIAPLRSFMCHLVHILTLCICLVLCR